MFTIFFTTIQHKLGKKIILLTLFAAVISYFKIDMFKSLLKQPLFRVIILSLSYMFLSLLWTPDFHEGKGIVENYLFYFIFPLIAFSLIPNQKYIPLLIKAFLITMFFNEIISYGIMFEVWGTTYDYEFPTPFMHHTAYSMIVTVAILILGYDFTQEKDIKIKIFYFLFLLTMSGNLILSGGRNGQMTLLLAIAVLSLSYFKTSYKKALILLLSPFLLFCVAYFSFDQFKVRTNQMYNATQNVIVKQDFTSSFGTRLLSFAIAEKYIQEYPYIFGEGAGSIKITKDTILTTHFKETPRLHEGHKHFHQYYISTLIQYGLIGVMLLLSLFYYFYKLQIKDPRMRYIQYITLLVMIFSNLADGMLFIRSTMIIFAIFIGLVLAQNRIESMSRESKCI